MQTLSDELARTAVAQYYFMDAEDFEALLSDPNLQDGINMVSAMYPGDNEILAKYLIFKETVQNSNHEYDSRFLTDDVILRLIDRSNFSVLLDRYVAVVDTWDAYHLYNYQMLIKHYSNLFDKWVRIATRNNGIDLRNLGDINWVKNDIVQSVRKSVAMAVKDNLDARVLPFILADAELSGELLDKLFKRNLRQHVSYNVEQMLIFEIMRKNTLLSFKRVVKNKKYNIYKIWDKLTPMERQDLNDAVTHNDCERAIKIIKRAGN